MRPVILLLGALTIVLAIVVLQQRRVAHDQLTTSQQQTENAEQALRKSQSDFKTFRDIQSALADDLHKQIASLTDAKAAAAAQQQQVLQQAESLKTELANAHNATQQKQDHLAACEEQTRKLAAEFAALTEKLRATEQELAVAREKAAAAPAPQAGAQPARKPYRGNEGIVYTNGEWRTVAPVQSP